MSRSGRGFEDDARQRVVDAARRSGLSVGELVQALSETPKRRRGGDSFDDGIGLLDRRLDALGDRMRRFDSGRTSRPAGRDRDEETSRILDTLEGLDRRIRDLSDERPSRRSRQNWEAPERSTRGAERDVTGGVIGEIRSLRSYLESRAGEGADVSGEIRRLATKIDRLSEQRLGREAVESLTTELGRLRDVVLQSNVEGSLKNLEVGYEAIVDRLDGLRRDLVDSRDGDRIDSEISEIRDLLRAVPQADHLSALERNLDRLGEKFERMTSRDEAPIDQVIDRRLGDLRAQLERFDPGKMVGSLERRLEAVTDKLDALERSTRAPHAPDRVIGLLEELRTLAAGNRTVDEIRALEERIADLGDRIADIERPRPAGDDTSRIQDRISEIVGRLERIPGADDGKRTVRALEAAVERLDAAIADATLPKTAQLIDERFDQLFDRLDSRPVAVSDATADVEELTRQIAAMRSELSSRSTDDLEAQMRLLAERLDHSVTRQGDDETLALIEEQLAHITRRIEENQGHGPDFSALEHRILDLAERIDTQHMDSIGAAREAAREMVRELAGVQGDGASESALRALQSDLRSLQDASRDTESRTNGTLVSLHDALTGIAGRLAAIEKIAQGSARSAAAARGGASETAAAPSRSARPTTRPVRAEAEAPVIEERVRRPIEEPAERPPVDPVMRAREILAGTADDNRPLEPGSGKPPTPRRAPIVEPAPGAAPSETPASPAAARKAEFIAAARRAAQAASVAAESAPSVSPEDRLPKAVGAESGALSRIGRVLKGKRRPLVLATAALVLAILTLQVLPGRNEASRQTAAISTERVAPAPTVEPSTSIAQNAAPKPEGSLLSQTPTQNAPGFSMPLATNGAQGQSDASQSAETAAPQTTPQTAEDRGPATTGSIPPSAAGATAQPTMTATDPVATTAGDLPEKIGPENLRRAAAAGDAKAAFEIGMRYAEGKLVPADLGKALAWHTLAAEKGLAVAQYRLGVAYEKGLGLQRDPEKAKAWYRAAAEQGNVRSMHNLGVIYANGRDMANAVPWFQKAADAGLRDSQFNMGIINAMGSGVKQDLAVSYKWFALAAKQGDKEAEKKQNEIAGHLDKVNLAAGRMAVQTWVQRPTDRTANDEVRGWNEPATTASVPQTGNDTVRKAQMLMKKLGLYDGAIDGVESQTTRAAVRNFQKKAGLPQTGDTDGALVEALARRAM